MKFTIGKTVPQETIESGFYLVMDFMHGDADRYETLRVLRVDDTEEGRQELTEAIELVDRVREAMKGGGGRSRRAGSLLLGDDLLGEEWPGDVTADHEFKAACQDYRVRYFDDSGVEYEVDMED